MRRIPVLSHVLSAWQVFNLHRAAPAVRALVGDPRMAATAAALLGAPRLRLFQDCVFVKRQGFGATNWHSDLAMAPLDTNAFVTAWIPLRAIQACATAVAFALQHVKSS